MCTDTMTRNPCKKHTSGQLGNDSRKTLLVRMHAFKLKSKTIEIPKNVKQHRKNTTAVEKPLVFNFFVSYLRSCFFGYLCDLLLKY